MKHRKKKGDKVPTEKRENSVLDGVKVIPAETGEIIPAEAEEIAETGREAIDAYDEFIEYIDGKSCLVTPKTEGFNYDLIMDDVLQCVDIASLAEEIKKGTQSRKKLLYN